MVVNQKIIASINEQTGNEFSAMLQYYAMAAHFGAEALPEPIEILGQPIVFYTA